MTKISLLLAFQFVLFDILKLRLPYFNIRLRLFFYCLSKKQLPILYSNLPYKTGNYFYPLLRHVVSHEQSLKNHMYIYVYIFGYCLCVMYVFIVQICMILYECSISLVPFLFQDILYENLTKTSWTYCITNQVKAHQEVTHYMLRTYDEL